MQKNRFGWLPGTKTELEITLDLWKSLLFSWLLPFSKLSSLKEGSMQLLLFSA